MALLPPTSPAAAKPGTTATSLRSGTPAAPLGAAAPRPAAGPLGTAAAGTRPGAPTAPLGAGSAPLRPGSATSPLGGTRPGVASTVSSGLSSGLTSATAPLSASGVGRAIKVTDDEFIQLRDFIYEKSGIYIAENRKYLIENRLNNRIKELNLKTFGEYYYYLKFDVNRMAELTKLFTVITTNETSFYRNPPQLQVFQDSVLPAELEKLSRAGTRKLRIWSAGCSTGEEPYTLAMILYEVLKQDITRWDIKITANDLSEAVLASARKGVYTEYALRTTPPDIIRRYFTKDGPNFVVDPKLKRLISFGPTNLSDRALLRRVERSHIIFCRNVIIYFDDEMKRQIIESFYDNLLPGGCLFIGHSESLHSISRAFKPEHHAGTIVYRKEA